MIPPVITPIRFSRADRMIVVICDRSPHSATKVIENACTNILNKTVNAPDLAFFAPPTSGSVAMLLLLSLFTWFTRQRMEKCVKINRFQWRHRTDKFSLRSYFIFGKGKTKEKTKKRKRNWKLKWPRCCSRSPPLFNRYLNCSRTTFNRMEGKVERASKMRVGHWHWQRDSNIYKSSSTA